MRHAFLVLMLVCPMAAQAVFQPAAQYPFGGGGTSMFARDVNGDGQPDVVADNVYTASVLPNLGAGVLGPRTTVSTGFASLNLVAAADLNLDGIVDLVGGTNTGGTPTVVVLLGNGNGTFSAPVSYPMGNAVPNSAVAGDLNGDGVDDVVVTAPSSHAVTVMFSDGMGGLITGQTLSYFDPSRAHLADLNGDGAVDIAVGRGVNNGEVLLFLNQGSGVFPSSPILVSAGAPGLTGPVDVGSGDLDGDGDLDVVVSLVGNGLPGMGGAVGVLINDGSANLSPVSLYPVGRDNDTLVVADLNGDGVDDVAVSDQSVDHVHVLLNDGAGSLLAPTSFGVGRSPRQIDSADMDGDGLLDLVTVNLTSADISVLVNLTPLPPPAFPYPGTMEDLRLRSGVAGASPTTGPSNFIKTAATNDSITIVLESPGGGFNGEVFGVGVQLFPTGSPPIVSAPGVQIPSPITLIYSGSGPVVFGLPPTGITLPLTVPPGFIGMSGLFQGAVFTPNAANGVFATTHGHEIRVTQ